MSGGDIRVLIVDDDKEFARGLARMFKREGCVIELAHSAERARELLETATDINGIVLDYKLDIGGPTGLDVLRSIRDRKLEVAVLFITAVGDASLSTKAHALRAQFCAKPLERENVAAFCAAIRADASVDAAWSARLAAGINAIEANMRVHFTPCERGVIEAYCRGMSWREYAEKIDRSINTIETHVASVLKEADDTCRHRRNRAPESPTSPRSGPG